MNKDECRHDEQSDHEHKVVLHKLYSRPLGDMMSLWANNNNSTLPLPTAFSSQPEFFPGSWQKQDISTYRTAQIHSNIRQIYKAKDED